MALLDTYGYSLSIPTGINNENKYREAVMGSGLAVEGAGQRRETIALIALMGTSEGVEASYRFSDAITQAEKREIAYKLRAIAQECDGDET
jgi:hypothetical protein